MFNSVIKYSAFCAAYMFLAHAAIATQVTVPGNATGDFGTSPGGATNGSAPFVSALNVAGPGTITIKYISGLVNYGGPGPVVNANGGVFGASPNSTGWALPLDESAGINSAAYPTKEVLHIAALIGAFVPNSRVHVVGFQPVDATKGISAEGILPGELFFVGEYHVITVNTSGTLYLGVNDSYAGDNSGAFLVNVTSP